MSARTQKLEEIGAKSQSEIVHSILQRPDLSKCEKLILIRLIQLKTHYRKVWATIDQIAEFAGCSPRHVYRIYLKLSQKGFLRRQRFWLGHHHSISLKTLVWTKIRRFLGIESKCHPSPSGHLVDRAFSPDSTLRNDYSAQKTVDLDQISIGALLRSVIEPETPLRATNRL